MVEIFKVGHFTIYLFGITIALGMIVGSLVMLKEGKRKGISTDKLMDLLIYTLVISVIGARLFYILVFNLEYYLNNPKAIFAIREGGLSIQGGLIFGIMFALWYTKKNNLNFWKIADTFAPGIIIGQAIGRIGCDVFGIPMSEQYFWGIKINNQLLHPTQIYEAILDLLLFMYLWRIRNKIKYNGEIFIKYIIGFSIIRGIVEFFRFNPIVFGPFTVAHVTSLVIIIIALLVNKYIKKDKIQEGKQNNRGSNSSLLEYIIIGLIGVVGVWFYYYIH
ncbi:prolipoprotein diacylglyceryl transferase [Clostridium sp. D2Q-11]|uniref:Phosphatidylglycerol--prolipoprotein diacylglyceryl transferase n=1 Tax=Anaeromonas frigoriresistens TaxID=2683708 RepID=A0A942Z5S8_9FIRM|nr:prolipoprotein diacylglyceryl transferase [Anaeromonas frigoriresistens]MBS4537756.1 prolipoprotein diacylglyceryl transferase [Anaeromonas frigoriresistens]